MRKEWKLGEVCEHGSLGRKCPICERDEEIALLRACVRAADLLMRLHSAPAMESLPGSYRTLREAFDVARAEVEP